MLFDLRGKRRRAVQVTYATLAVLMGGGLVLFGIGGSGTGSVFDLFDSGGGSGNSQLDKRIERQEARLATLHALLANIQDLFNEHGVQIMSPHYMMDPAARKVVAKRDWWAAPAEAIGPGPDAAS